MSFTTSATATEGVIKFHLDFTLAQPEPLEKIAELSSWRQILYRLGLTGQEPDRYDGLAFGNVSQRTGRTSFLISGTRTGCKACLSAEDYCLVLDTSLLENRIRATGPIEPSSEALAHGAVYASNPTAGCVIHAHSPDIWRNALGLGIPLTDTSIAYGTPEMGRAVGDAAARESVGIIAMGGHEDGVLAFDRTPCLAAVRLLQTLEKALEFDLRKCVENE